MIITLLHFSFVSKYKSAMPPTPDDKGDPLALAMDARKSSKLGLLSGVYIPVCLNIMSILMFLRFGLILGQVGFLGILGIPTPSLCLLQHRIIDQA